MFAFNFPTPSSSKSSKKGQVSQTIEDSSGVVSQEEAGGGDSYAASPEELPAEEISVDARFMNTEAWRRNIHTCKDGTPVHYFHCRDVEERLCAEGDNVVAQAFQQNSDLIRGVYEGGLKVWECSVDLVDYLSKMELVFREKEVLELGCGVALPGLYALSHQGNVTFQDYNEEVLTHCTMPNSVLNLPAERVEQSCRFYCGGWKSFTSLLEFQGKKFDVILTSETIYRPSDYPTLHNLFNKLASESATVYVAGKVFYFGLGGGSKDFADFVKEQDVFSVETTGTKKKGVLREVLVLKRKSCLDHITLPP